MDLQNLFREIPSHMATCRLKKSLVKSGRWFSWHSATCDDHVHEWFCFRMLLEYQYPTAPNPDTMTRTFKESRSDTGGLQLALQCTSFQAWQSVQTLRIGARALWTWWAKTIKHVKSPDDGLKLHIDMTLTWRSDDQLCGLVMSLHDWKEIQRAICLANKILLEINLVQIGSYLIHWFLHFLIFNIFPVQSKHCQCLSI